MDDIYMEHTSSSPELVKTRCCIVGGGPAGMIAGLLLARAGVDVVVLEKHADFLRDFRGDTIHPSTLEVMYELGMVDELLKRPYQPVHRMTIQVEDVDVPLADLSHLPTHCKFVALMPQWDFLNFIAEKAKGYPQFHLLMETEATDLIIENGRVAGVRARTTRGPEASELEVRADLTLGADGRHSIVRERAGLEVINLGAPIDVLWMRFSRRPSDGAAALGRIRRGRIMVTLDRGDYWQCAYVIPKSEAEVIKQKGLPAFREAVAAVTPFLSDRTQELKSWDDIKLLTVRVDHLRRWWRTGLLCIGDSAHAMSPVGGVGINLAIQDAVAAANILAEPLLRGTVSDENLRQVQERREFPTRMTQRIQIMAHKNIFMPALSNRVRKPWWPFKLFRMFPVLQRIPARALGLGFRPEHVRTAARQAPGSTVHGSAA
jgi:2-polyprenyl-6-methoxyphenol hydroxylase-like FAD-dependent oxidoreductase